MNLQVPRLKSKPPAGDDARFLRNWLQRPLITGAVSPSSRWLGRMMAGYVSMDAVAEGRRVLELGPGTGAVTRCLIEAGIPEEQLVLVEYSPEFVRLLRARHPRAHVIEGDAYHPGEAVDALAGPGFAAVVSSLPLFTRPEVLRETLLGAAFDRMPPGNPFIQFSYALTLPVKPDRVGARIETSPWVRRNLPPARVLVYRRG
ncbi:class I SAM-dependent methyltransferase [Mangrovibrevibacter kandeliae]|uniref:class I SAM-dependent methyltransferase n=1 Tax=Mangrovibrevibacter kandeliae TaxID=2968473 RepID=UPI0021189187|nr:methyltransferase domain-containing protein [Aurantimonas sp. CSK15Z-1]MCQ8782247.1 methyltransferase domain-containing protein [Aurantimonas sp. CSK15Z-1]